MRLRSSGEYSAFRRLPRSKSLAARSSAPVGSSTSFRSRASSRSASSDSFSPHAHLSASISCLGANVSCVCESSYVGKARLFFVHAHWRIVVSLVPRGQPCRKSTYRSDQNTLRENGLPQLTWPRLWQRLARGVLSPDGKVDLQTELVSDSDRCYRAVKRHR